MLNEFLPDRFLDKVQFEPNSGCWLWVGAVNPDGYGRFWFQGSMQYPHRVSYRLIVGGIDEGLQIDHLCRVRCCVNPDHLEPVTNLENTRRGNTGEHERAKTHCPQGHPYDETNTYVVPKTGSRQCRDCRRENNRRWRQKKSGESRKGK